MTEQPPGKKRRGRKRATKSVQGAVATVRIWGKDVGAVAEDPTTEQVVFEYARSFRETGLEISPLRLPLATQGPQVFPELLRIDTFQGLPGVLADCLPDAFGNAIIRRYFEDKGTPEASLSPVQRLLYMGSRAMGALEFAPAIEGKGNSQTEEALEVARLVEQARRVVEGDTSVAVPEIMQVGASAGGARAKALVLWDRAAGKVRSGFASPTPQEEPWLIKFDGVSKTEGGHALARDFKPGPYGRIEYAYSLIARRAGIEMAETHLLREREFAHFMTKRFDRHGSERVHMHSLGGMHHVDYNVRQVLSYEDYFRTIQQLDLGAPALEEAFRRMVFNVVARNQDDHVKNVAFLMDKDGSWRLAPAFDMIYAVGGDWAGTHQMRVNNRDDNFAKEDILAVGAKFGIPQKGQEALDRVLDAVSAWPEFAESAELGKEHVERIGKSFRLL